MPAELKYWFPAKRYGWGWGFPLRWQGWLVMIAFVALLAAGVGFFPPATKPGAYFLFVIILITILTGICWLTGEPPRWRWGDKDRA